MNNPEVDIEQTLRQAIPKEQSGVADMVTERWSKRMRYRDGGQNGYGNEKVVKTVTAADTVTERWSESDVDVAG